MSKKQKNTKKQFISLVIVTIIVAIASTVYFNYNRIVGNTETQPSMEESAEMTDAELEIHFIDVGQGDSVFIELPDETCMLIDAGNPDGDNTVSNYISGLGYAQIDYLIVTHGDNDHVGEIPDVLDDFEVKNIYRPFQVAVDSSGNVRDGEDLAKVYDNATVKSSVNVISNQAFGKFVQKAYAETYTDGSVVKNAMVSTTYDGLKIMPKNGNSFAFEFFGPLRNSSNQTLIEQGVASKTQGYASVYQSKPSYDSLVKNEASPVMLLEHSSGSYLFTGDATVHAEEAVLGSLSDSEKTRFDAVDVYHVGHHGADNSTSDALLEMITPKMAVISVGAGNSHGHPTAGTLEKLGDYCSDNIYRSDLHGNILILANATDIQLKTNNVVVGNLGETEIELPPDEYWYVYVAGITAAVFVSGVIYIMSNGKIKAKPYKSQKRK
ncbi:MAG: MBL fold metallo-hydrolase [Clostridia bacterium]|nr:MBL fold metallo-hydrolase [Clostridia bacterium]